MVRTKRVLGILLAIVVLASPFIVWSKQQAIADWWRLRGYTPPSSIVSLADADTMTASAKHIFFVNHPQLVSQASTFRQDCSDSEKTIVLGCYHSDQNGIYAYDVTDSRLNGVEQVTMAHEMLHAAYDRLSSKDRNYIDGLLNDYFNKSLHDQRIIDTINSYRTTEPHDITNEMHSVFGTEAPDLPAPLESYYQRYFTNRGAVVAFAQGYENEFTSRLAQINAYDQQLSDLKNQIDVEEQSLNNQLSQLNADRARLDGLRSSGQIAAYNAAVPGFNDEIDSYNSGVAKLQRDISSYNSLVETRNAVAADLRSLDSSIDTRLTTQSSQ